MNVMPSKELKNAAYLVTALAAATTLAIGLHTMSNPYSQSALGLIVWAVSPYGLLALLVTATKSRSAKFGALVLSVLASILGLALIIDAMYIHLDAQGGLVYIFAPLWQWVGLLVLALPVLFLNRVKNA